MAGGTALKAIPGIGTLATMGIGAFEGWNDASNIMGKDADSLTTVDKMQGAAYGAASALTFGLVDPKTIKSATESTVKFFMGDPAAEYAKTQKYLQEQKQKTRDAGNKAIQSTINSELLQADRLRRKAALRGDQSLTGYEKFKMDSAKALENINNADFKDTDNLSALQTLRTDTFNYVTEHKNQMGDSQLEDAEKRAKNFVAAEHSAVKAMNAEQADSFSDAANQRSCLQQ